MADTHSHHRFNNGSLTVSRWWCTLFDLFCREQWVCWGETHDLRAWELDQCSLIEVISDYTSEIKGKKEKKW